jgi:hypothetical protein
LPHQTRFEVHTKNSLFIFLTASPSIKPCA